MPKGKTVMPGLYDSHTHPLGAATSELDESLPALKSLEDVFAYLKKKTTELPKGEWIVMRFAFPTRLKEARFPTRAELDKAAPDHPVLYNAGPASMVNSKALEVSKHHEGDEEPGQRHRRQGPGDGRADRHAAQRGRVAQGRSRKGKASSADRREGRRASCSPCTTSTASPAWPIATAAGTGSICTTPCTRPRS